MQYIFLGILAQLFYVGISYNVYWYDNSQTQQNRQLMVHLFEWKWTDIANECEQFLSNHGYGAVQISPPMEHIKVIRNDDVPWWVRYQPVSYKLISRSGNEEEFVDMVNRCNKVGMRIIVDVVMNHMVGIGQKFGDPGILSSGGSRFDGTHNIQSFPAVPYDINDFNNKICDHDISGSDYQQNAANVKDCRLVGLLDLNQTSPNVQKHVVAYLNRLIDHGVAGFRFDASKHMWPNDILQILNSVKNLRSDIFGINQRPFAVHEVIDRGGEAVHVTDYISSGRYTNFNFGAAVSDAASGKTDWKVITTLGPGFGYGNGEDHDVLNFIDNHDNQRDTDPYVLTYKNGQEYSLAVSFMLAWPYGYPRVMSSYQFDKTDQGPPNLGVQNNYDTKSPKIKLDGTCDEQSGWVCEHRWPVISAMAMFRSDTTFAAVAEIVSDYRRIAFAREEKGFFALNQQDKTWKKFFQTSLPAGQYCDYISGGISKNKCNGQQFEVDENGNSLVAIEPNSLIAISIETRIDGPPPLPEPTSSMTPTVILLKKSTNIGEFVFIRGGVTQGKQCSIKKFDQENDECAFWIKHNTTFNSLVFDEYSAWSQKDEYLDFEGVEKHQGTHDGRESMGTPLIYSTNDPNAIEYQSVNKYGPDYWMVQLNIDCTKIENGWFELKGYSTIWEEDIHQESCGGNVGGVSPVKSINHIAKCGFVNVFEWNSNNCIIDHL